MYMRQRHIVYMGYEPDGFTCVIIIIMPPMGIFRIKRSHAVLL